MNNNKLYQLFPLDIDLLKANLDKIPRDYLSLFEYKMFSDYQLRQNHLMELDNFFKNSKNFAISLFKRDNLKGYLLIDYMPYDSEIFEFEAYRIRNFAFLGKDFDENELIINSLLNELDSKIVSLRIKYLTISLNANNSCSNHFFNSLLKNNFYYIHTLLTFKMTNEEFKNLNLYKQADKDIAIRLSKEEDSKALFKIAKGSYKINRFHLDRNLNKAKCDLLHARSAENSILHGFADVVYVAEYKNEIVGYYSGKKNLNSILQSSFGNAIISAVSRNARGMGIFSLMNNNLLKWFDDNTDISEMGTYITNTPVHKTWTSNGLSIVRGAYQLAKYNS